MHDNGTTEWVVYGSPGSSEDNGTEIAFLGDVALAGDVGNAIDAHGTNYPFQFVNDVAFNAEIVVFNLECCLSERGEVWEPKPVVMRGGRKYLDVFPSDGQSYIANLANNHFLDFGSLAAADTIDAIDCAGMKYIGAEGSKVMKQPLYQDTVNGRVAFMSYAPCAHPISGEAEVNVAFKEMRQIFDDVKAAKSRADIVMVSLHQGVEFSSYPDRTSRNLCRGIVDAGGDIVICHHTHLIQGYESYKDGMIFYGIGNFLIKLDTNKRPDTRFSLVVKVRLTGNKVGHISLAPFEITNSLQVIQPGLPDYLAVRRKFEWRSALLKNKAGLFVNDLLVAALWGKLHFFSLVEMLGRKGVVSTIDYYSKRVLVKLGYSIR